MRTGCLHKTAALMEVDMLLWHWYAAVALLRNPTGNRAATKQAPDSLNSHCQGTNLTQFYHSLKVLPSPACLTVSSSSLFFVPFNKLCFWSCCVLMFALTTKGSGNTIWQREKRAAEGAITRPLMLETDLIKARKEPNSTMSQCDDRKCFGLKT